MNYAPSAARRVTLSSSNPVASVPASVTVSPASYRASFTVATSAVSASTSATISAAFAGLTQTALITVRPGTAPPPSAVLVIAT